MAVSPVDLLAIAQELMGRDGEIYYRSAANRAYYSAYHFCRELAATLSRVSSDGRGSREKLINRLKNHQLGRVSRENDFRIRTLGNLLAKAKPLRTRADYYIGNEFGRAKAEELILRAEEIRDVVSELTQA